MSIAMKRNITSSHHETGLPKRQCLVNNNSVVNRLCSYRNTGRMHRRGVAFDASCSSSSSSDENDDDYDDDNDSDIEQVADRSNLLKAKSIRFADSICAAPIDSQLSKAVSQYSDDNDDEDEGDDDDHDNSQNRDLSVVDRSINSRSNSCNSNHGGCRLAREENCNSSPFAEARNSCLSKKRAASTNDILNVNYVSGHGLLNNKRYSVNISDVVNSIPNNNENFHSFSIINKSLKHSGNIPRCDFIARSRCFEYLVGAIDEAWARYCDSTSYDEDLAYGYDDNNNDNSKIGRSMMNNGTDRHNDVNSGSSPNCVGNVANTPSSNTYSSDEEGYKTEFSATTTLTEYDSDFHNQNNNKLRSFSMINNTLDETQSKNNRRVSEVPENVRLQELKDRFTKSKYYLEDLVDSDLHSDCLAFWTKWDLIKYSIVDFVEEDEEDDDIERKIDELESGRFAGSFVN